MKMSINEEKCTRVRFEGFRVIDNDPDAGRKNQYGMQSSSNIAGLGDLKTFLLSRGIVENTFDKVIQRAD